MTEEQDVTPASLRRGPVAESDELTLAITRQLELDSQYVEHVEVWDTKRIAEVRSAGRRAGRLLGWKTQTFRSQPTDQGRVAVLVMLREWPDEEMRERLGERARLLMDEAFSKLIPRKNPPHCPPAYVNFARLA